MALLTLDMFHWVDITDKEFFIMSEARSKAKDQVVTLLFCNLGSHDPHTPLHNFTNDITSSHRGFSGGSKGF